MTMTNRVNVGLAVLFLAAFCHADDCFEKPFRLKSGGELIDVNTGHAAPFLHDFDGDGIRDLLVGEFGATPMKFEGEDYAAGRLRIYRNVGTDKKPRYDGFEWFKAGGEIAQVPITCCVSFCPEVVDWDGDGDMDILTGSYPGHLYLYRNSGKGEYAAAEMLINEDGEVIKPESASNPRAYDWDGDGDLDLVIASGGGIHLVRNNGTRKEPEFDCEITRVEFRGEPIRMRGRLGVEMADWNKDGRDDMLIGQSAGVLVLCDSAKEGDPIFKESGVLVRSMKGQEDGGDEGIDYPGRRWKVHVADYNGDGLNDLLVGDVNYGKSPRLRPNLTEEQLRDVKLRAKVDRLVVERDLTLSSQKRKEIQSQIMELLGKLMKTSHYDPLDMGDDRTHGHVWVYLRKKGPSQPRRQTELPDDSEGSRPKVPPELGKFDLRSAFEPLPASGGRGLRVRLGPESKTIEPGKAFRAGLFFELTEGWTTHAGTGDSSSIRTKFELPKGFEITSIHWPEPHGAPTSSVEKPAEKSKDKYYARDFVVTVTIAPPAALPSGTYNINVHTDWQACDRNHVCTLGESFNRLQLTVGKMFPTPVAAFLSPANQGGTGTDPSRRTSPLRGAPALSPAKKPDAGDGLCATSQPHKKEVVYFVRHFTTDQKHVKQVDLVLGQQREIGLMNGRVLRVLVTKEDGQVQVHIGGKKNACKFGRYTTVYRDDHCVAQVFIGHSDRIPPEF